MKTRNDLIKKLISDTNYQIFEDGRVRKKIRAWDKSQKKDLFKTLKTNLNSRGYVRIFYKGSNISVHRIVSWKFIRPLVKGDEINHKDGNKLNNHISNLEIVTRSENMKHAYKFCLAKIATAKLSWNQVTELRQAWGSGNYTQRKLSEKYGVCQSAISAIVKNKTYVNENGHKEADSDE